MPATVAATPARNSIQLDKVSTCFRERKFALGADQCHNGTSGEHGDREVEQMRRERDAAPAVVEAARQHKCLGRTDGYNFGWLICHALAVTPRLTETGEK